MAIPPAGATWFAVAAETTCENCGPLEWETLLVDHADLIPRLKSTSALMKQ
jgi:hypothetical protein